MDDPTNNLFQVSVKGMFFNDEGKLLMIKEDTGIWELPGGRIQKGEGFIDCLQRECVEETGLEVKVLEQQPSIVYPTIDKEGRPRMMVFYKVHFNSLDFKPSSECQVIEFYNKNEIEKLNVYPQLKNIVNFL